MKSLLRAKTSMFALCVLTALAAASPTLDAWAAEYPAPATEIGPEHPLAIHGAPPLNGQSMADYARALGETWAALDENLRAFSVLRIGVVRSPSTAWTELLDRLQEAGIPVVLETAASGRVVPLAFLKDLVGPYGCVKGVYVSGLAFNDYHSLGAGPEMDTPPEVHWLTGAVEQAARSGKIIAIALDDVNWPRVMSNPACRPLYLKLRECSKSVVPLAPSPDGHSLTQVPALMGLWLEGAVNQWGLTLVPTARITDLRAAILAGAMTGATAYDFSGISGASEETAAVTLHEVASRGVIAPRRFVAEKIKVGYQLAEAATPQAFHDNLRDINTLYDDGSMVRAAYGVDPARQMVNFVPASGRHFWIPVFSAFAPPESLQLGLARILRPNMIPTEAIWREVLGEHYPEPREEGAALIARVGRGVFVLNTSEDEVQDFSIPALPAPLRGFRAEHAEGGVRISWPFREGDVSYRVYRCVVPDEQYTLISRDADGLSYLDADAPAEETVAYAVTALTSERETYAGTVAAGEHRVLSVVESRIAEEAELGPYSMAALSRPFAPEAAEPLEIEQPQEDERARNIAAAIEERIAQWRRAFESEDLDGVMGLYADGYEDPQGWRRQYVQRAYKWFFQRYSHCGMYWRVEACDIGAYDVSGIVTVRMACRLRGVALTDPTGHFADREAYFPRTAAGEVIVSFTDRQGSWHILQTNPAVPSFNDILSFSAAGDEVGPGADY